MRVAPTPARHARAQIQPPPSPQPSRHPNLARSRVSSGRPPVKRGSKVRSTAILPRAQHSHQPRSVDSIGPYSHHRLRAPQSGRCEDRCENDFLRSPHPLTALFNSPFIERGVCNTTSPPLNAQTNSQTQHGQLSGSPLSENRRAQGWCCSLRRHRLMVPRAKLGCLWSPRAQNEPKPAR